MMFSGKMRNFYLAGVVSVLVGVGSGGAFSQDAPQRITNLREALSVGVQTNPEYGIAVSGRLATDESLLQGQALFLPSVDLNGDFGVEHSDDVSTRARGEDSENLWRREFGVTLTQMLFDGFRSRHEVARQEARVTSSVERVHESAELVGLSIVESYLEVLRQRQLLGISRDNVRAHLKILNQIQDGIRGGRQTRADGAQVRARLAAARAIEASTIEALRIAGAGYRRDIGVAPGALEMPVTPYDGLSADVDQEVIAALAQSPTLDAFTADIEAAYAEAQGTKSTQYPQFDLRMNARSGDNLGGVDGRDTSASALVVMNWNLYRGGGDVARAREFVHRHQQSKEAHARAVRRLENDVRRTWASMIASGHRAGQFAVQSSANSKVVRAYQDQFDLARRTLLDVLDSQNELFVSRSSTLNAEFLEMFAVYRLMALKGSLFPTLGVEYPR